MIRILKYDLKQIIRENIFMLVIILIITGIYFPSFSTLNGNYLPLMFSIYGVSAIIFMLDLLNKGIRLQIIVDFPKDTIFFLRYLSFKFQILAFIIYTVLLCVMKILFSVDLIHLIPFYISIVYLSLGYYFLICLSFWKRTNLNFIDVLVLSLILLFTLAVFKIIFYIIGIWIILPVLALAILFNLFFISQINQIIAPIIFDILENSNESN